MSSRYSPPLHAGLLGCRVSLCDCLSKVTGPLSAANPDGLWVSAHPLTVPKPASPSASWADLLVLSTGSQLGAYQSILPCLLVTGYFSETC